MIERAYSLAYFILGRRDIALQAAEEAMARLETAMSAQDKRLYYHPTSGGDRERRSRVWLEEAQQLQRLVYVTCEPHERAREQGRLGDEVAVEDLVVHLIKHLARITVRRNAFHVVLGICRLLYNYSTAETMDLHNLLVDRPEDVKDDSYYRARKTVLLREMAERFAGLITLVQQHRGEERFAPMAEPQRYLALVIDCLDRMAPWDTPCWPERRRGAAGGTPTEDLELRRIHAALHPDCLQRLVAALCLQPPQARLDLPRFDLPDRGKRGDDMTDDRRRPPPLSEDERAEIEETLRQRASARGRARADVLRIVVDGQERGRLDPSQARETALAVGEGAEVVEIWAGAAGSELLLGTALLGGGGNDPPPPLAITLEGGQRLSLQVTTASRAGTDESRRLTVAYRETRPGRALQLAVTRARRRAGAWVATPATRRLGWSMAAVALVGAAIFTMTSGDRRQAPGEPPPLVASVPAQPPHPAASGGQGGTRSVAGKRSVTRLDQVRRVFLEPREEKRLAAAAVASAAALLENSRRFTVVPSQYDADAVLKVEATAALPIPRDATEASLAHHRARLRLRLVNAGGDVLWPPKNPPRGGELEGAAGPTAEKIVRALLAAAGA